MHKVDSTRAKWRSKCHMHGVHFTFLLEGEAKGISFW